mmetsp:Transcript_4529/g.6676  ORF Transcript_4529/g.6676 Transcript_4529/m.6676 type:complete len:707 (-) Transcript_4529:14-2134(-)
MKQEKPIKSQRIPKQYEERLEERKKKKKEERKKKRENRIKMDEILRRLLKIIKEETKKGVVKKQRKINYYDIIKKEMKTKKCMNKKMPTAIEIIKSAQLEDQEEQEEQEEKNMVLEEQEELKKEEIIQILNKYRKVSPIIEKYIQDLRNFKIKTKIYLETEEKIIECMIDKKMTLIEVEQQLNEKLKKKQRNRYRLYYNNIKSDCSNVFLDELIQRDQNGKHHVKLYGITTYKGIGTYYTQKTINTGEINEIRERQLTKEEQEELKNKKINPSFLVAGKGGFDNYCLKGTSYRVRKVLGKTLNEKMDEKLYKRNLERATLFVDQWETLIQRVASGDYDLYNVTGMDDIMNEVIQKDPKRKRSGMWHLEKMLQQEDEYFPFRFFDVIIKLKKVGQLSDLKQLLLPFVQKNINLYQHDEYGEHNLFKWKTKERKCPHFFILDWFFLEKTGNLRCLTHQETVMVVVHFTAALVCIMQRYVSLEFKMEMMRFITNQIKIENQRYKFHYVARKPYDDYKNLFPILECAHQLYSKSIEALVIRQQEEDIELAQKLERAVVKILCNLVHDEHLSVNDNALMLITRIISMYIEKPVQNGMRKSNFIPSRHGRILCQLKDSSKTMPYIAKLVENRVILLHQCYHTHMKLRHRLEQPYIRTTFDDLMYDDDDEDSMIHPLNDQTTISNPQTDEPTPSDESVKTFNQEPKSNPIECE